MNLRVPLFALLVAAPLGTAAAQACVGSFAVPPSGARNFYLAGVVDQADFSDGSGARVGFITNNQKVGVFNFHVGYRSIGNEFDVESHNVDVQFVSGFPGKSALARAGCFVIGIDADLGDSEFAIMDTYFGMSFGHDFVFGPLAVVPFGMLGFNGVTFTSTEEEDYYGISEVGVGVRLGSRLSATLSSRTIYDVFERNVTRLVVAIPFGPR